MRTINEKNLFTKIKAVIVVHESTPDGPGHHLKDFLLKNDVSELLFIAQPLLYFKEDFKKSSRCEMYKNGKLTTKKVAFHWILPGPLLYLKDFFYTLFWCFTYPKVFDVFWGANPLNGLIGLLLKKVGKVKKVVFYSIDYTPQRFPNRLLNWIYHEVEKFCCYYGDVIWVGTERTVKAWENSGFSLGKMAKTVIVPDGNHALTIKRKKDSQINKNTLVYLGHLGQKQGIDLVLESIPTLGRKIKNLRFIIIGKGDYLDNLKEKVKKLRLKNVEFKGYLDDLTAEEILTRCGIGIATYVPDKKSFTYYSEAGKPKYYLGCGLPVVITKVPSIAFDIERKGAGRAINYSQKEFVDAVLDILDKDNYKIYKKNATSFGLKFDWSIIFNRAIEETRPSIP